MYKGKCLLSPTTSFHFGPSSHYSQNECSDNIKDKIKRLRDMDMKTFLVVSTPNWSHIMIFWIFVAISLHVCTCISEDVKYKDVEDVIKRLEQLSRSRKSHQLSGKIRFVFNLLCYSLNLNVIEQLSRSRKSHQLSGETRFVFNLLYQSLNLNVIEQLSRSRKSHPLSGETRFVFNLLYQSLNLNVIEQLIRSRKSHQLSGETRFVFNLLCQNLNLNKYSVQEIDLSIYIYIYHIVYIIFVGDGPTFTRWGRPDCSPTSELVYSGKYILYITCDSVVFTCTQSTETQI